ncbi:MAG: insulinase family protein [Clostridia bacterium]|nr:insulinase family protein [Clostridia bacterium]
MKKISETLLKGITLHYVPTEKFTSNYFSVHFVTPLAKETVSLYSLLSKVLTNGCVGYPDKESFSKRLLDLYAAVFSSSVTKIGEEEALSLSINMLDDRFSYDGTKISEESFALLRDLILHPVTEKGSFPSDVVEREKKVLIDEIEAAINNKNTYAIKRCREIMCEGELYSLSVDGDVTDVAAASAADVYRAYTDLLKNARIEMIYVGKESLETVKERVRDLTLALGERSYKNEISGIKIKAEEKRVEETVSAVQGKLTLGFRLDCELTNENLDALRLFNLIYGSSPVAKLFMNVREKLSLCYYCASRFDAIKGVLFVYSGVENDKMTVAEEEILRQLENVKEGKVTEEELLCAKKTFRDVSRSITDSAPAMEKWVLDKAISGEDRLPSEVCDVIESLTVEDVRRVAASIRLDTVFRLVGMTKEGLEDEV